MYKVITQNNFRIILYLEVCVKPPEILGGKNMGIFASFSKGFNAGKERAENQSYRRNDLLDCPVELVEPSVGNVVEFKVTEKKNFMLKHICGK